MKTLKDFNFNDKRVLMRADLDVPIDEKTGEITDDFRLRLAVPTIKHILKKGVKQLIIMGHMDSPEGKVVDNLKMDKVAAKLMLLLGKNVYKTSDCVDINLSSLATEKIILLENLRFHAEEEKNDDEFAKKLASYADVYVNNAFATCHRAHASMHAITKYLPGCIGLQVEKEVENLDISKMQKPIVAILGGAKLKTKIPMIQKMLVQADSVLLAGAMIFTFYSANGLEIGNSLCDNDYITNAKMMLNNEKLILPKDIVIANASLETGIMTVPYDKIPKGVLGLDIGEQSIEQFKSELRGAVTVIWNGPLGYCEKKPFDKATAEIARFMGELKCHKIAGGGDTADIIHKLGYDKNFTFISSGGGASLELLSGKGLVALQALEENGK
ncbi:phosphoglycerate kinase [Candidatus Woesearchaeota archaeon]|nr:phosphoglycerate kinase [Candidatus Woesearchaeota archaeon]